ncbi:MAG: carboxyl transferase domain-containing protein [Corticimicrobacter sp.]|uniref:carboxyl transferase domain-containing protein n=1 Tax=Corticimicrobacter sp. TaxID=2678536 RepID=UPI0032DBDE9D
MTTGHIHTPLAPETLLAALFDTPPEPRHCGGLTLASGALLGHPLDCFVLHGSDCTSTDHATLLEFLATPRTAARPLMGIFACGPAADEDGHLLERQALLLQRLAAARGQAPYLSIVLTQQTGTLAALAALADLTLVARPVGSLALHGPNAMLEARALVFDADALGGPAALRHQSGLALRSCRSTLEALRHARLALPLLSSLQSPVPASAAQPAQALATLLPDTRGAFDCRELVDTLTDAGSLLAWHDDDDLAVATGIARLRGRTFGIVSNRPQRHAGHLGLAELRRIERFLQLCRIRRLPVLSLIDTGGLLPALPDTDADLLATWLRVLDAWQALETPRISIVPRLALGAGALSMGLAPATPRHIRIDWQGAGIQAGGTFADARPAAQPAGPYHLLTAPADCPLAVQTALDLLQA